MKYTIHVTKKDILKGRALNEGFCPVALAAKRALKCNTVRVGNCTMWFENDYKTFCVLPQNVSDFISDFDWDDRFSKVINRSKYNPFSFSVNIKQQTKHAK